MAEGDYEKSELIAISEGKKSLGKAKWLFNRKIRQTMAQTQMVS